MLWKAGQFEVSFRARETQTLINIIQPDPARQPSLITDQSYVDDVLDYPDGEAKLRALLQLHFNQPVDIDMHVYFWQFVDRLGEIFGPEWVPIEAELHDEPSHILYRWLGEDE